MLGAKFVRLWGGRACVSSQQVPEVLRERRPRLTFPARAVTVAARHGGC